MGANPNTQTLKEVWMDQYQISHYKQPVFRAIAEEKMLAGKLKKGATVHWSYMSDFYVENMGADGSYNTQAQTDTDETLVINQVKDTSFYEFEKDLEQAHYNVKVDYAKKAMNKVFLQIDADVLFQAYSAAGNVIDAGILSGGAQSGVPITVALTNIFQIFALVNQTFLLANVQYDPNLTFTKEVKLEKTTGMSCALISPQTYTALILYLGGKTTVLGDKVSVSGHAGAFMSSNIFVTNQLTSTLAVGFATNPSDGDAFTINGLTFTFRTSPSLAGEIKILGSAALTQALLISVLAAPFTAITTNYPTPQTNNVTNQIKLANITLSSFSSNLATLSQSGIGSITFTIGQNTGANVYGGVILSGAQVGGVTTGTVTTIQHNIFALSRSVAIVIQKYPTLYVNPVTGKVGKDYVTWCYYGIKVFKYQAPQIVDVQVASTSFTQPTLVVN